MPQIIMHNQMSLDGAVTGFQVDLGTYYQIMNSYQATMYLLGSNTALSGIEMFAKRNPEEKAEDFNQPAPVNDDHRPFWVIPDSEGKLQGLLHIYRNNQHCRDAIILLTKNSPEEYISYLDERNYRYIVAGETKVDFKAAVEQLKQMIPFEKMITDNGGILSSILFDQAMIDQVSLMISPTLTDKKNTRLFRNLKLGKRVIKLKPLKADILPNNDILLLYDVIK